MKQGKETNFRPLIQEMTTKEEASFCREWYSFSLSHSHKPEKIEHGCQATNGFWFGRSKLTKMLVLGKFTEASCRMPSITPITGPMQDQLLRLKSLKPQHVLSLRCEVLVHRVGYAPGLGGGSPAPQLEEMSSGRRAFLLLPLPVGILKQSREPLMLLIN